MNNSIVEQKRNDLFTFIRRELFEEPTVRAVVAIGSVATGLARPDSDIDAALFLEPFDLYSAPAEFQWTPQDGAFHGIFVERGGAVQFDFKRLDLAEWSKPHHVWPEPLLAELAEGWVAFDRDGTVQPLLPSAPHIPANFNWKD
jgi:predicted nucleotidyltransferase